MSLASAHPSESPVCGGVKIIRLNAWPRRRALSLGCRESDYIARIKESDALDRWYRLGTTTGRGGREPVERSTSRKYALHQTIIASKIGAKKLSDLDQRTCEAFRDSLLESYSRPCAKKILTSFKSALKQAVADGALPADPAADVYIRISKRQQNANKITIPDLAEVNRLTATIDRLMRSKNDQLRKAWSRYEPLFYTQLYAGLRPTEVRGLSWRDIDRERGGLQVTQDADAFNEIGALKSGAAYRYISLPEFVMDLVRAWEPNCPNGKLGLVFPNWAGKVESLANITNRGWYPLCKHARLTKVREDGKKVARYHLNTLRHVKASLEIALGCSPKRIQEIMGHEDIKMTFDVYGHLFKDQSVKDNPDELLDLVQSVAQILPGESKVIDLVN